MVYVKPETLLALLLLLREMRDANHFPIGTEQDRGMRASADADRRAIDVLPLRRCEVVRRNDRDDSVPITSPAPNRYREKQNRQSYIRYANCG